MIYLVTVQDRVTRLCKVCGRNRSMYIAVTEDATIVACCFCDGVHRRYEHAAIALDARSRPTAAPIIAPSVGRLGTVRGDGLRAAR